MSDRQRLDPPRLNDDERQKIEEQFSVEFTSGTDVDNPGEVEIDIRDADEVTENAEENMPVYAADGGTTVQTADSVTAEITTPVTTDTEPKTDTGEQSSTTAEKIMQLEEEEQERYSYLFSYCMKSYQGERPRRRLVATIEALDGPGYDDLAETVGKGERAIKDYVKELRDAGIVVTQGKGSASTHVLFESTEMEILAKRTLTLTEHTLDIQ